MTVLDYCKTIKQILDNGNITISDRLEAIREYIDIIIKTEDKQNENNKD